MNTTDCRGRLLAYEFGLKLIPARKPQLESFDALELDSGCGVTRPTEVAVAPAPLSLPANGLAFHVDHEHGDDATATPGSDAAPFRTVHRRARCAAGSAEVHRPEGWHPLPQRDD
jgi:hypothetical protein